MNKPNERSRTGFIKECRRLITAALPAAYAYLLLFCGGYLLLHGEPPSWFYAGVGFHELLRWLSGALVLFPLTALLVCLPLVVLYVGLTRLLRLDEERRLRWGVVPVAAAATALLGLRADLNIFHSLTAALSYLATLGLGALLVWGWFKRRALVHKLARICGWVLAGGAALWLALIFLRPVEPPSLAVNPEPAAPVNIVVVLSDAHRADVNALYGGPVPTPNLERLARRGVTYDNCYSPSNWTVPAVTALFSGLEPAVNGMDSSAGLRGGVPYLPLILQHHGWRTRAAIANNIFTNNSGLKSGFDYYALRCELVFGGGFLEYRWGPLYLDWSFELALRLNEIFYDHTRRLVPELGLELVDGLNPGGGDLVYIHLFDVHDPYAPPEEYRPPSDYEGRFERDSFDFTAAEIAAGNITPAETAQLERLYEGEARVVDDYLGRILDIFDSRDLWDNTALVFTGDHGEEFAEHGDYLHGGINLHPELTHVPLVVYWPGRLQGGRRVSAPVSLCDLHPTVLEALGLDYDPDLLNGVSLLDEPDPDRAVYAQRCNNLPGFAAHSDWIFRRVESGAYAGLFLDRDAGTPPELYLDYYARTDDVAAEHPALAEDLAEEIDGHRDALPPLAEHYGTSVAWGYYDEAQLEQLRAVGYMQ